MSQRNVDDDEATELLQKELLHVRNQHGEALIIIDRHKPVIEAAKAWADVRLAEPYKDNADQADRENLSRFVLLDALDALLAAEGED